MSPLHPDMVAMADAVELLGPARYALLGRIREVPDEPGALPSRIASDLYERLYLRPSQPDGAVSRPWDEQCDFLASLSAANHGPGAWEDGWRVHELRGSATVVREPGGLLFLASASEVAPRDDHLFAEQRCRVRVGHEFRRRVSGYYFALGDRPGSGVGDGSSPLIRYYWNLPPEAAPRFVAAATSSLATAEVPYRLKVLRDPAAYVRADAGVLYIDGAQAPRLGPLLEAIHEQVRDGLREAAPLLTLRLGHGLGCAMESAAFGSFGMHRCRLIAGALWHAFLAGEVDRGPRLERLAAEWRAAGLDPSTPYLGAGVSDVTAPIEGQNSRHRISRGMSRTKAAKSTPLEAAWRIGRRLCQTAHWDREGRECNWVGRSPLECRIDGRIEPASAALGAELYGGSAGIALFLAQLSVTAGDEPSRRTALAAIERSLRVASARPERLQAAISLFEGRLGVAWAACQIGNLLDEPGLVQRGLAFLPGVDEALSEPHPFDFLGGDAGAIPALLELGDPTGLAVALGEELCRKATHGNETWTWTSDSAGEPALTTTPLCGMSHGASGIAVGLMELHSRTKRAEFLAAARGAFAYEDSVFDSAAGNWPDLRPGQGSDGDQESRHGRTWCHGAPGIALARLRATELDPDHAEWHQAVARIALRTTLAAIDDALARDRHDASPCHGLAGLVEVVLVAGRHLADRPCAERAHEVTRLLIARHDKQLDYPSGLLSRALNPSLMLGLAGTGYAFLRLHDPDRVPSILVSGEGRLLD